MDERAHKVTFTFREKTSLVVCVVLVLFGAAMFFINTDFIPKDEIEQKEPVVIQEFDAEEFKRNFEKRLSETIKRSHKKNRYRYETYDGDDAFGP